MSTTRTVPVSSATYQNDPRQKQQQQVNWDKQKGTKADGITLSVKQGYRLGDGGGGGSETTSASANATNNIYKTVEEMDPNRAIGRERNSSSAKENRASGSEGLTKPLIPIEEYYAQKGVDFHRLRKETKVQYDTSGSRIKQKITVDYFNLPSGYTKDDLPDSQGPEALSESMEEIPISPAVLLASQCRREKRVNKVSPKIKCDDVIESLKRGRRNRKESKSSTSTAINDQEGQSSKKMETETEAEAGMFNGSFPEDSFNDFELVMASQQVENEFTSNQQSSDLRKRDINGNTKNIGKPFPASKESPIPFTSTPNPRRYMKLPDEETPKARSFGLSRIRHKSSTQINCSLFEKSGAGESPVNAESEQKETETGTPRKVLRFEESPIKHFETSKSGDFWDDEDDDIFSQIDIPGEVKLPGTNVENKQKGNVSEKSTNNVTIDSFMDESELAAIAKLEALNCRSGSTSGDSSTSLISATRSSEKRNTRTPNKTNTTSAVTETPRTRSRRLGLSLHRNKRT